MPPILQLRYCPHRRCDAESARLCVALAPMYYSVRQFSSSLDAAAAAATSRQPLDHPHQYCSCRSDYSPNARVRLDQTTDTCRYIVHSPHRSCAFIGILHIRTCTVLSTNYYYSEQQPIYKLALISF